MLNFKQEAELWLAKWHAQKKQEYEDEVLPLLCERDRDAEMQKTLNKYEQWKLQMLNNSFNKK